MSSFLHWNVMQHSLQLSFCKQAVSQRTDSWFGKNLGLGKSVRGGGGGGDEAG